MTRGAHLSYLHPSPGSSWHPRTVERARKTSSRLGHSAGCKPVTRGAEHCLSHAGCSLTRRTGCDALSPVGRLPAPGSEGCLRPMTLCKTVHSCFPSPQPQALSLRRAVCPGGDIPGGQSNGSEDVKVPPGHLGRVRPLDQQRKLWLGSFGAANQREIGPPPSVWVAGRPRSHTSGRLLPAGAESGGGVDGVRGNPLTGGTPRPSDPTGRKP